MGPCLAGQRRGWDLVLNHCAVLSCIAGSGRNAFVNISKTRAWFDSQAAGKEVYRKELQAVMLLRR